MRSFIFLFIVSCMNLNGISIIPFHDSHIEQAFDIIFDTIFSLQIVPCDSPEEIRERCRKNHSFDDLCDVKSLYFNRRGTFLVMVDDKEHVMGMGALKYLDTTTCELKRMFFSKEYWGKCLGTIMMERLIEEAKQFGYTSMRLEVYNPIVQIRAVKLYKKFGFYEVAPYNNEGKAKLFMEKQL